MKMSLQGGGGDDDEEKAALGEGEAVACSAEVEARLAKFFAATQAGHSLVEQLRGHRDFGNPYHLEEVISTYGIEEKGTAFPARLWNPLGLPAEGHAQSLDRQQLQQEEARRQRQATRTAVVFSSGVLQPPEGPGVLTFLGSWAKGGPPAASGAAASAPASAYSSAAAAAAYSTAAPSSSAAAASAYSTAALSSSAAPAAGGGGGREESGAEGRKKSRFSSN